MDKEKDGNLVWVDLEMTGLDVNTDHIIEMACIVTDKHLNVIAEGEDIVIHQPDNILERMNEWCVKTHRESGLTQAVKDSQISLRECERRMIDFITEHTNKGASCLAGNSVHADKEFLKKYMPEFMEQLHYRIVDVSTIKELTKHWFPKEYAGAPKKQLLHRALQDIKDSIAELRYYRKTIFKDVSDDEKFISTMQ